MRRKIPLSVKLIYTAFVAVLIPCCWVTYRPWNFLFFCDVALLAALAALWLESPLLASVAAVGITLPQTIWVIDFLIGGRIGIAGYMFDPQFSLFLRGLSTFHGWLPFLLVWLVWRLGYDRRALAALVALTWILSVVCFTLAPGTPAPAGSPNNAVNINYVHGMSFKERQTRMHPALWLAALMVGSPIVLYLPTHLILRRVFLHRDGPAATDPKLHAPVDPARPSLRGNLRVG